MKNTTLKTFLIFIISCLCTIKVSAQTEIINPAGKWYFGAEMGTNRITSFNATGHKTSLQGGVMAEYYFARHWSLSVGIKYFKTGVSFYVPSSHSGSWFDLGSDASYGTFKAAVVAVPLNLKWEFRIYKNLAGSLKLGTAFNVETKSTYSNYSPNLSPENYDAAYFSISSGYGFNYFLNKNYACYFDYQAFNGSSRGKSEGLLGSTHYPLKNRLVSLGVKYTFGS